MIFGWQTLLNILPERLRGDVDTLARQSGQEIRLRLGGAPQIRTDSGSTFLADKITREDLSLCVNLASRYSPWNTAFETQGFIPLPGGHRLGLCGETAVKDGLVSSFREIDAVCIRIARDISQAGAEYSPKESLLILGPPGYGKTTLLRCLARRAAEREPVCVLDQRWELFPRGFPRGKQMDVLSGCPKGTGMELLVRSMSPGWIALDEITGEADGNAIVNAAGCGVKLMATAHAGQARDLLRRPIYRKLLEAGIFSEILVLHPNRQFTVERAEEIWHGNGWAQS